MLLDLTELSSYLPLVSSFEFGNVCGKLFPCTEGRVRTTHDVGRDPPVAGPFDGLSALLVWAWHHTSHIHARVRVAEASTRKKGASNAAPKEDDMNSQRMFTVQKSLRGVCVSRAIPRERELFVVCVPRG